MATISRKASAPAGANPGRLGLIIIPVLSTLFGYIGGHTIGQQPGMAGFGLLWGTLAMLVGPRLATLGASSAGHANAPVYVMLPLSCIVLGGSLLGHVVGAIPAAFIQLLRQPGYGPFFYAFHGPFEWVLMPWALMANWHYDRRRRLLVVAAAVFYAARTASALYFAPSAIEWGAHPAEAAAHVGEVATWIELDLARVVLQDVVMAGLMLTLALHPAFSVRRASGMAGQASGSDAVS